jgi:hypothetical protein
MSWNLGGESQEFSVDARELVLQVFLLTMDKLDEQWKRFEELMEERIEGTIKARGEDEVESVPIYEEMALEQELQRQRKQGVGALALDWLMYSLKDTLNRAKRYFDESHPAKPRYKGDGWIAKMKAEYLDRFGIDLEQGPHFTRIEELTLARNAGIHRDEKTIREYLDKTKEPRFVDFDLDGDDPLKFDVPRQALFSIISEAELYVDWVISELKVLRRAKATF